MAGDLQTPREHANGLVGNAEVELFGRIGETFYEGAEGHTRTGSGLRPLTRCRTTLTILSCCSGRQGFVWLMVA